MNTLRTILLYILYGIGMIFISIPLAIVTIVVFIAYPIIVIFSDILVTLGFKKR